MLKEITVSTAKRNELVDITNEVQKAVNESGVKEGICVVYCPHTTAGITVNEGADPDVKEDVLMKLGELVPESGKFKHSEGNSDSHIKSSLIGCSQIIIIEKGRLLLGRWQALYFAEFDGPRERTVFVKVKGD